MGTLVRDIASMISHVRGVPLPFSPPLEPMLCKLSHTIPEGAWMYEPKWDGFRCLVFRDGDSITLQSRDTKPLERYFPELIAPLRASVPERCVLDGEIVIATDGRLDFDALLQRIHPAVSRINELAGRTPASYVAWDLLALGDEDLRARPQSERREALERALAGATPPVHLTPMTRDPVVAADWFNRFEGAGFDGIIAKPPGLGYQPGKRGLIKVKHDRTADCVVAGFRWYKGGKDKLVGSLLLGLYDDEGKLHHLGVCSAFSQARRAELAVELAPLRENAMADHPWKEWAEFADAEAPEVRQPGATSRWNRGKDLSWEPLRIERVVEVGYDHLQGDRFRHSAQFKRWRPDRQPADCRYDQLEVTPAAELAAIFARA
jgi:ATP-dependent DNA ligase